MIYDNLKQPPRKIGICEVSNWKKKRTKNTRIKEKRDRSIFSSNHRRGLLSRGILLLSNNVDDEFRHRRGCLKDHQSRVRLFLSPKVFKRLSDHRRVPPRVPLSSVCRSMAPEHVGCRDTRETPARGVGKERRRERESDLDVDSSATAWTRLGDERRTARRDAVSED